MGTGKKVNAPPQLSTVARRQKRREEIKKGWISFLKDARDDWIEESQCPNGVRWSNDWIKKVAKAYSDRDFPVETQIKLSVKRGVKFEFMDDIDSNKCSSFVVATYRG